MHSVDLSVTCLKLALPNYNLIYFVSLRPTANWSLTLSRHNLRIYCQCTNIISFLHINILVYIYDLIISIIISIAMHPDVFNNIIFACFGCARAPIFSGFVVVSGWLFFAFKHSFFLLFFVSSCNNNWGPQKSWFKQIYTLCMGCTHKKNKQITLEIKITFTINIIYCNCCSARGCWSFFFSKITAPHPPIR